jgi:hypothetical protein
MNSNNLALLALQILELSFSQCLIIVYLVRPSGNRQYAIPDAGDSSEIP